MQVDETLIFQKPYQNQCVYWICLTSEHLSEMIQTNPNGVGFDLDSEALSHQNLTMLPRGCRALTYGEESYGTR